MKIIPSSIQNIKLYNNKPSFCSNSISEEEKPQVTELSAQIPDYNVRVPIAYNHVDDIKLSDELSAKCYKLANGQRVVIVPKEGSTVVKTYVNTGSFNEPDNLRGISHYIEHNLFNGSEALGDKVFFDEVNKIGGSTNAATSFSDTNYYISSHLLEDTDLEEKIKLHAGMLTTPKFLVDKLEKEKKIVNSEINMCVSENGNLGAAQTIKNLFNINSSSLDLIAGSTDNITALTRDDVVNYFNNNYYPANMTTVITGEVDPEKTIELVAKYFNSTKNPQEQRLFEKMTPTEKPVRQDIISPKTNSESTTVLIGFVGPENNNTKDKIYTDAMSYLASELYNSRFANIERNYGVRVSLFPERLSSNPNEKSLIVLETNVPESKSELLIKDIYTTIDKLSKNPPTEEELTAIKNRMKKDNDWIFEDSYALNNFIGKAFLNDSADAIKDYSKIIDNMTASDIQNTAKKYLNLNKAALTVVHPNGTTKEEIDKKYKLISDISFTGANKKTPVNIDNIKTYRTSNNYEVVFNNAPTNTIQYRMTIEEHDWTPKKAAISDILSDMFENAGTSKHSVQELARQADTLGISSSLRASDYGLHLKADFPDENFDKALSIFKERILSPNFDEKEFQESVQRLKDRYLSVETNPYEKFDAKMYEGTPLAFTTKELLDSLYKINLDDVKNYYKEIFEKGQGKIVVTGAFDKRPELKEQIFESLNNYPTVSRWNNNLESRFQPIEKTEVFTDTHLKNQADIIEGFRYKQNGNLKDNVSIALLNMILGGSSSSRLFGDLRETRHLAYFVSSSNNTLDDMGIFKLQIGTTTENQETGEKTFDNVKKSIEGFNENIEKIKTEKVSEEELAAAKKRLKASILESLETNSSKNSLIYSATETPYGIDYANKYYKMIDEISAEDIYNTANYIFKSKPIYSLTATKDTLDANKEYLESLVK